MGKCISRNIVISMTLFLLFSCSSYMRAERWDIQVSYGGWSLSPFTPSVERKSEEMIREEYVRMLSPYFSDRDLNISFLQVNLRSSGKHLALAAWHDVIPDRFSVGFRGCYFNYRIPYDVYSQQIVSFLGFSMAELETQGSGHTELGSIMFSFLARYKILDIEKFKMSFYSGVSVMPFDGKLRLEGHTTLRTPAGTFEYLGSEEHLIKKIREWNEQIPSWILSPALGFLMQYRITKDLGFFLDGGLSHGMAYSAGIFFTL